MKLLHIAFIWLFLCAVSALAAAVISINAPQPFF